MDEEQQPDPDRNRRREIDEDQGEVPRSKDNGDGLRDAPVRKRAGGDGCSEHCHCDDEGLGYPGRSLYLSGSSRARPLSHAGRKGGVHSSLSEICEEPARTGRLVSLLLPPARTSLRTAS